MTDTNEPTIDLSTGYQVGDIVKVGEDFANTLRGARLITPQQHAAVLAGGTVESVEERAYPVVRFGDQSGYGGYGTQAHRVPAIWLTLIERPAPTAAATSTEQTSDGGLILAQLGREIEVLRSHLAIARSLVGNTTIDLDRLGEVAESVQVAVVSIATLIEATSGNDDLRTLVLLSLNEAGFSLDFDIEPNDVRA